MTSSKAQSRLEDAVATAVILALDALRERPAALITDIDGTISRIVSRPEDAVVSDSARTSLRRLAGQLDLVAAVTAREEAVARRMIGLDELTYVGNYALDAPAASLGLDQIAVARERALPLLERHPGLELEEKGISFALHYRNCPDPDSVRLDLLDRVGAIARETGTRLLEGKRVVELVPAALTDKGAAIARLLESRGIRGVVYLGDDVSDVAAFNAIGRRRQAGLPGVGVAVIDAETPPDVREAADVILVGVDAVEAFLARLVEMLDERGGA